MPDLSDSRLADLERLYADRPGRWTVQHAKDGTEAYWIESPRGTVCEVEEVEPGEWDADTRAEILGDLTLAAEARNALPALLAELRRRRAADADPPVVVESRPKR
jgi:hypothetical protein